MRKLRILFSAAGGHGHLQPLLPLAQAAAAAGHSVLVSATASLADHVTRQALPFTPSGPDLVPIYSQLALHTMDEERQAIPRHFIGNLAPSRARDLHRIAISWEADLLVGDEADYGAVVAAETVHRPHATVITSGAGGMTTPSLIRTPLQVLRAAFELPAEDGTLMLDRSLNLNPFPPSFRDPAAPLTGSVLNYRPAHLSVRPVLSSGGSVYVTLGTIFNTESGDLLARIATAAAATGHPVIVAIGEHLDRTDLGPQPPQVTIHRFVNQRDVLAGCAAVVCHGGSGTVLDALSHGLPMVILPLGADQPLNAARAEDLGCAVTLPADQVTATHITNAVTRVLTQPAFRAAATRLHGELRQQMRIDDAIQALTRTV